MAKKLRPPSSKTAPDQETVAATGSNVVPIDPDGLVAAVGDIENAMQTTNDGQSSVMNAYKKAEKNLGVNLKGLKMGLSLKRMADDKRADVVRTLKAMFDTFDLDRQQDLFEQGATSEKPLDTSIGEEGEAKSGDGAGDDDPFPEATPEDTRESDRPGI